MKNKTKGFTVVEYLIVFTIVGLLAAMAIPAFQKVKVDSIAKAVASGRTVSDSQYNYLKENLRSVNSDLLQRLPADLTGQSVVRQPVVQVPVENFQTIVINGKIYRLVPQ